MPSQLLFLAEMPPYPCLKSIHCGANVCIVSEQSRSELLLNGMTASMPESYVDKLASSKIVSVNHLLPSVSRKIEWPEQKRDVILIGTRGLGWFLPLELPKTVRSNFDSDKKFEKWRFREDQFSRQKLRRAFTSKCRL